MANDGHHELYTCVVCGEGVDARMSAECNWCDQRYHLNQRNDIEAKDCGQVWIDEQYLALQFACNNCMAATQRGDRASAPRAERKAARLQARRPRRYKRRA